MHRRRSFDAFLEGKELLRWLISNEPIRNQLRTRTTSEIPLADLESKPVQHKSRNTTLLAECNGSPSIVRRDRGWSAVVVASYLFFQHTSDALTDPLALPWHVE
ncbi:hypothetical protein CEXT_140291 [Caerostris extrusa]|uniref:Uncharacterized protein n=1 Tax=Caerostris extrusa TaxID=172846 RepID=A0AAV4XR48_CAEEX|nr:hypothetical protein CEXT_140291 [Caerostris extrusa]